ncbi:hypothetical protein [Streptomyces sp. CA-132043]|uniref:hypothetical protein n=1 Tax=Streptomyces sp. CA-132043 TaxID=3240048 RepID=UPI003D9069D2
MPRPTAAQLVYGSATVVLSTLAMLLLSQTRTGIGAAVIAIAGLGLGLLVAVTAPLPRSMRARRTRAAAPQVRPEGFVGRRTSPTRPAEARVGEHSR